MDQKKIAKRRRGWSDKFADAFRGIITAVREERSFTVHLPMAGLVVLCAVLFRVSLWEWCVLVLCIAVVLAAEAFNSAIETLSRSISEDHDPRIGKALDMAGGAVLLVSLGTAIVGATIFLRRLMIAG